MKKAVIYVHGQGGSSEESKHYEKLFPDASVIGIEYTSQTPWDARTEFKSIYEIIRKEYEEISVIANSIGAYFVIHSLADEDIEKAYFISPVVDMENLIMNMMEYSSVTEDELKRKGSIGDLSWEYLSWVRENPIHWEKKTSVLYGAKDNLQSLESISAFAEKTGALLCIMEDGEHWFHTKEQMDFLDSWIMATEGCV